MGDIANMDKWHEEFMTISNELNKFQPLEYIDDDDDDHDILSNDMSIDIMDIDMDIDGHDPLADRMTRMQPLFAFQPKLETVCQESRNHFIRSSLKHYMFYCDNDSSDDEFRDEVQNFEYTISLCGYNLTSINLQRYPCSDLMPIIRTHCLNLKTLKLQFKSMKNEHFEMVFSHMFNLEKLVIVWLCKETIPTNLIDSLKSIGHCLKLLILKGDRYKKRYPSLPDEFADLCLQLTSLKRLHINYFNCSQTLLKSLNKLQNLIELNLAFSKKHNLRTIMNLKKLTYLYVDSVHNDLTDQIFSTLCKNVTNLEILFINGSSLSDVSMINIGKLKRLRMLSFLLTQEMPNLQVTSDCLRNLKECKYLQVLNICNFTNADNHVIAALIFDLQELTEFNVTGTAVNNTLIDALNFTNFSSGSILRAELQLHVSFNPQTHILINNGLRIATIYHHSTG